MRIGIDILGGDFAPEATVKGSILAAQELKKNDKLVLFGPREAIETICKQADFDSSVFDIVHTEVAIEMGDHPVKSFSKKQDSSMVIGFGMLASGMIDGFASAGNTGAMLVGATQVVKLIPGVIRPSIATAIPRLAGPDAVLLDIGINPDCKPDVLYQYAILGSIYSKYVNGIDNPRVGLLNIGTEEEKGNLLTKATYQSMKDTQDFNFIGNVEGNDFFDQNVNVFVCDGFVGNIMLKQAEAFYKVIRQRKIIDEYFEKFNYENIGGTPVLGVNKPVIIGHGISNANAIKSMILQTRDVIDANLPEKIKEIFKQ